MKVPTLMEAFGRRLERGPDSPDDTPDAAFDAHYKLAVIHPFSDGNGRCARLLMNLVLIRGGYPPIAVGPEDRARYLASIEESQLGDDRAPFKAFMCERLAATLGAYLELLGETIIAPPPASRP